MNVRFAKMHGLGNDFMVVDCLTQRAEPKVEQIRRLSDRHTGVGFDQFLAVLPPNDPRADFLLHTYNADGSEAKRCGNGARCFARFVFEEHLTIKRRLVVETLEGNILTELLDADQVRVDMGVPSTEPAKVPFLADEVATSYAIDLEDNCVEVTPVWMGNPHAVIFVDNVSRADIEGIGSALQHHKRFPDQVNVGFLQVVDRHFGRLRVYERGTGETRACGTGACAAMVAAQLHDRFESRAKISLPGGKMKVEWKGQGSPATLEGPAELVYTGRIEL